MNVEENFPKSRIHSFLKDITELCKKHNCCIYMDEVAGKPTIMLHFANWEDFSEFDAYPECSSVYWPRIASHVMHEVKADG